MAKRTNATKITKKRNRKNVQAKNSDTLKMLKDLPTCRVVLHNIALDKDLVQLYQLCFFERKKEKLEHSSSCINATKSTSNVQMREDIQEDNTVGETPRITRSHIRKLNKMKNKECKKNKSLNNLSYNRCPKIVQPEFVAQEQQLECDTSVKSFSNGSTDETTSFWNIYTQKKTMLRNNKRSAVQQRNRSKRRIYSDTSGNT